MTKTKNNQSVIRHFSPAWFAASMGTGGLANLIYQISDSHLMKTLGTVLFLLNLVLFILLLIPWILRWFLHFDQLNKDIKHPVLSNFFVTMPIAGIILGTNFILMRNDMFSLSLSMNLSLMMWCIGVVLILGFAIYTIYNMMMSENMNPETSNFSWFITPVASIVIPLLGNQLVKYYCVMHPVFARFLNLMNLSFFGIGFMLFIILSGIVINRFIMHKMPPAMILPTFWIILGPIGMATVSLMGLADVNTMLGYISDPASFKMIATAFWGFGFWALGLLILITFKYMIKGKIPFSLSWWAFTFPLAAYGLSALAIYNYIQIEFVYIYSIIITVLLSSIWVLTSIRTLIGVFNQKLLIPQNAPIQKDSK